MKTKALLVTSLLFALHPSLAEAKLAAFELKEMILDSSHIVICEVVSRTPTNSTLTNATVRVLETWKGKKVEELTLDVRPTWTCDISTAKQGETILLFVLTNKKDGKMYINNSGRGRMPIDKVNGKKYATFWPEVWMPEGIEIIEGPEPRWDFIRRAKLDDLKQYIKKTLGESPNK